MLIENIFTRFLLYTGLEAEEGEVWRVLCEDALREVQRRRNSAEISADRVADLENVAAAKAFLRWTYCFVGDGGADRISVGEISVAGDPKQLIRTAEEILKSAQAQADDLLDAEDFAFVRTAGV